MPARDQRHGCVRHHVLLATAASLLASAAAAQAAEPIKIGVIAEQSTLVGQSISQGAELAAADLNAKGGVDGRKVQLAIYDDHSASADAVRAFQRAVEQDQVRRWWRASSARSRSQSSPGPRDSTCRPSRRLPPPISSASRCTRITISSNTCSRAGCRRRCWRRRCATARATPSSACCT